METKTKQLKHDLKRQKTATTTDSDSENDINIFQQFENRPRFLMIHGTDDDNPLSKLSSFAVHKGIEGIAGIPKDIKRLRSGDFLLEVNRESHANNLLKITHLVNIPVTVFHHKSSKGVIRCRDLINTPDNEILENLTSEKVTDCYAMMTTLSQNSLLLLFIKELKA